MYKLIPAVCLLFVCTINFINSYGQQAATVKWWNPADTKQFSPEGQGWPGETSNFYGRLPNRAAKTVRQDVYELAQNSAGIIINFTTSAPVIKIQYSVKEQLQFPHMQATGVSGVDLYFLDKKAGWLRAAGQYAFKDTIQYTFSALKNEPGEKVYKLLLPLYNTLNWLRIGVDSGYTFTPVNKPAQLPVIVYGTSIAQGACASRPGMAWTAILGRALNMPVINLGFSGNGRLEPEVIDLINELDAKIYVLDCLPNLAGTPPLELENKIISAVKKLRKQHPATPVLLTEHLGFGDELINKKNNDLYKAVNNTLSNAFAALKKDGVSKIYLLQKKEIGLNDDCIIDQIHPNDAGMLKYAEAYRKKINAILQ